MKTALKTAVGSARWLWRILFVVLFVLSIAFNAIAVLGGALFSTVSGAVGSLTGAKTLVSMHADEVAELNAEIAAERRVKRELRGDVADLTGDLAVARTANRELRGQVTELGEEVATSRLALRQLRTDFAEDLVSFKGRKIALREAVGETADAVSSRAAKSAARETAAMAGEALPFVGVAVIVGVTALEVKDLCETIRDMNSLKRALNPELEPSEEELTVCSMAVPSRQELWAATVASPGAAWEYSKAAIPSLEDIREIEWPSRSEIWSFVRSGAQGRWEGSVERSKELYRWLAE
jgi:hypothetical protein